MGCCESHVDDTKRHPLLRSTINPSNSSPSNTKSPIHKSQDSGSSPGISIHVISNLEVRDINMIITQFDRIVQD